MDKKIIIFFFIFLIPFLIDIVGEGSFIFDKRGVVLKKESLAETQDYIEVKEEKAKVKDTFNIDITINNIDNAEGVIRISLFNKADGFPATYENNIMSETKKIRNPGSLNIKFESVKKGEYAIAVFNDKNSNSELDTGIFGIPLEQYGFSNNPEINFRAPTFNECKFVVDEDETILINLN